MRLKNFQTETLSVLGEYLKLAREFGAKDAFEVQAESLKQPSPAGCVVAAHERSGRGTYLLPEELRSIQDPPPYVCLRVPTGGGKTLLASYAVGLAFGSYFEAERGFVLWLAPSKEIVVQTLNALRNPRHPYRLGLQEGLGSTAVQVVSVPEALSLNRADVEGSTIVVVGTVQAWRVTNQEGRKVFEDSGRLLDFQESLSAFAAAHPGVLQPKEGGRPLSSLGNLIASRRPLMILDEAHNMGSRLSFEALRDLNPRCILEFTATPDRLHTPSNVLHQVRAVDVKKEGMIKLPIEAESAQTPQEALLRTKVKREALEALGQRALVEEGRYLRPIALIQAEPDRVDAQGAWTVQVVKDHLVQHLNIPEDQIKIATGELRELKGIDLFKSDCPVRYIITQQALAEGWDCSFAYVLCSMAVAHSATSVEQILGRVLRMPQAKPFAIQELNRAYAVVRSDAFLSTIRGLRESLVNIHGFSKVEANKAVQPEGTPLYDMESDTLEYLQECIVLPGVEITSLPESIRPWVRENASGQIEAPRTIVRAYATDIAKASQTPSAMSGMLASETAPAERGVQLRIPWLLYQGERFSSLHLNTDPLPVDTITDETLKELRFTPQGVVHKTFIDINDTTGQISDSTQSGPEVPLPLDTPTSETPEHLASDLDAELHRGSRNADVRLKASQAFCLRLIKTFIEQGTPLHELDRGRYRLKDAVDRLWAELRLNLRRSKFSSMLLDTQAFEAEPAKACAFGNPDHYQPHRLHEGKPFKKHLFRMVAHLNTDELVVADMLESLDSVEVWVKNLDSDRSVGFWLPYPDDQAFFPDFVAQLRNGKVLVVEVKGQHLEGGSEDKRKVLELWGSVTGGVAKWVSAPGDTRGKNEALLMAALAAETA